MDLLHARKCCFRCGPMLSEPSQSNETEHKNSRQTTADRERCDYKAR